MDLLLEVDGGDGPGVEIESLHRFLRADDALRSVDIEGRSGSTAVGAMGPVTDALIAVCGSGGIGVAVVEAVVAWLKSRRSTLTMKITTGDRTVEISVESIQDPAVIAALLSAGESGIRPAAE
jgi:hypothetical protein